VKNNQRLTVKEIAPDVWRATASYGFMERPDIPKLLKSAHMHGCNLDLKNITYYIGTKPSFPAAAKSAAKMD